MQLHTLCFLLKTLPIGLSTRLLPCAAAAAAADFVVGLHQAPYHPDDWYILQGCSGSVYGGQVVGLLGPSGECACMQKGATAEGRAGLGMCKRGGPAGACWVSSDARVG